MSSRALVDSIPHRIGRTGVNPPPPPRSLLAARRLVPPRGSLRQAILLAVFAVLAMPGAAALGQQDESDLEARTYKWRDGDRTLEAVLQPALTESEILEGDDRRQGIADAVLAAQAEGLPVFRSQGGSLMMLPGGVLLVVDAGWSEEETAAFFAANEIPTSRVSPLSWLSNGYLVQTEPGFASLELANALAELDGVEISSPNWWRERSSR